MKRHGMIWTLAALLPLTAGCYGQKMLRQPVTVAETAEDIEAVRQQQAEFERRMTEVERRQAETSELLRGMKAENALLFQELQDRLLAIDAQLRDAVGSRDTRRGAEPYWSATPRGRSERETEPSARRTPVGEPSGTDEGSLTTGAGGAPGTPDDANEPGRAAVGDAAAAGADTAGASTTGAGASSSGLPPGDDVEAKRVYDQAYLDLTRGNYSLAILGFREYLRRQPTSDLADNAQYWVGESYYAQRDYDRAIQEFQRAVEDYPRGDKVPAALLKVGYSFLQLGDRSAARRYLNQLAEEYPNSSEAELARSKIRSAGLD